MSLILALFALTLPIAPQQGNIAPNANAGRADDAMVCKYQQKTGTRFKRKTCRTRAQWDAISESSKQTMKDTVDRPQIDISRCPPTC